MNEESRRHAAEMLMYRMRSQGKMNKGMSHRSRAAD